MAMTLGTISQIRAVEKPDEANAGATSVCIH